MTASTQVGFPYLASGQAVPETTVNEALTLLEAFSGATSLKSRASATPPGSPAQLDRYLVAASPTGAWAGQAGKIAVYVNTAWDFVTPWKGLLAFVIDEAALIYWNASLATQSLGLIGAALAVNSQSGTTYTAVLSDAASPGYVSFTSSSAVTFTIPPNSSVALPVGSVIRFEQSGTGTVTLAGGSGVTVRSRGSVFGTAGQYAVATAVQVATNVWTLSGDIA